MYFVESFPALLQELCFQHMKKDTSYTLMKVIPYDFSFAKSFLVFLGTCFDWQKVFLTAIPLPQLHKTVGVLAQSMWEG